MDNAAEGSLAGLLSGTTAQRNMTPTADQLRCHISSTPTAVDHPLASHGYAGRLSFAGLATTHWLHFQPGVLLFRGLSQFGERGGVVASSAPQLRLFDRLGHFAINGHGNDTATHKHFFRIQRSGALGWALGPAIGRTNHSMPIGPWV